MTDYIIKNGYAQFFHEADIQAVLSKVEVDALKENDARRNALISIMVNYPAVMDCIRMNHESVFDYTSSCVILNPKGLNMYKVFNPRSEKTMYTFFLENKQLKQPCYTGTLYRALNECHDFDIDQFMKEIVSEIPPFNAFHDADVFMSFFMDHLEEMSIDAIEEVLKIYKAKYKAEHEKEFKQYYAVRRKLLEVCPDGKYDQRLLDKEYAALEQAHAETYAKYKAIREEHRRIWEIQSCVEKGCNSEQTYQKKDHRKQEER